jgi:hypothetical protein
MIKGWRRDSSWRCYYESRQFNATLLRQQAEAVRASEAARDFQQRMYDEAAKHNAECHARKVESGEIQPQQAAH